MRRESDRLGSQLSWPAVGDTLAKMLRECIDDRSWMPVLEPEKQHETLDARTAAVA